MAHPISRRDVIAGMAALELYALVSPNPAMAETASNPASSVRPLAERLAAYADKLRYADLDEIAIEAAKTHLIDTLGCGIAAFDERPVRVCREIALAAGGSVATVIGTNRRTTAELATFANSAASRYYDLNDVYVGRATGHPSDGIAACIAVAEAEKATTQELINAIVLMYEVNCRLLDVLDFATRGWDSPVAMLPAVALAAGKLMKLTPEALTHAVSLALNDHIPMNQTRVQTLSDWKGIAAPEAARNAVFATVLARGGISAPAPIFEGRNGFFRLVSGPATVDTDGFGQPGVPFRINVCGMKAYPAQVYTQTAVVAGAAVAKEAGDIDRIAAVEIATTNHGYRTAGSEPEKWAPDTRDTADHSLPYITARAMFDGDLTNESYAPDKLRDPRMLAFMKKITVKEDPALTARLGKAVPTRVTAIMDDGRRISREVDDVPGFASKPMTRSDAERKFRSNVGRRWPEERIAGNLQALWTVERSNDLAALLDKLSLQPTG